MQRSRERPSQTSPQNDPKPIQAFHSRSGKAYLFNAVVNVSLDPPVPRVMLTGHFTVRDVDCKRCAARLGWYYAGAAAADQRYKVGRTCLERASLDVESDGGSTTSGGDVSDDDDACA